MFVHGFKKLKIFAATVIVLSMSLIPAAYAYDTAEESSPVIAPKTSGTVQGVARSAGEISEAQAAEQAKADAAKKAAEMARQIYQPVYGSPVAYSTAKTAGQVIQANGTYIGNYKLTFYCPCRQCSGGWGSGTSSGARAAEGRTIAVDPKKIKIGSRIYIEGYGSFIAEDVGGAIKGNRIDVFVNSHSNANALGVQHANVYVMN